MLFLWRPLVTIVGGRASPSIGPLDRRETYRPLSDPVGPTALPRHFCGGPLHGTQRQMFAHEPKFWQVVPSGGAVMYERRGSVNADATHADRIVYAPVGMSENDVPGFGQVAEVGPDIPLMIRTRHVRFSNPIRLYQCRQTGSPQ